MSATRLVHALAGRPEPTGTAAQLLTEHPADCCVCGQHETRTAPAGAALGANFTDRRMFTRPGSTRVCTGCLWCCSGKPPLTLRMWTVIAAAGLDLGASQPKAFLQDTPGLLLTSRADTTPVARILADPPDGDWLVSIALSGQKHVLPYARVNRGRGRWTVRCETVDIHATPQEWLHVHTHAVALRRLGVPADDVLTGIPRYITDRASLDAWRAHDTALTSYLRSPLLQLALWTITKGTLDAT